jgi:hypothetical protein
MARLDLTVEHSLPIDAAHAKFEEAIAEALVRFRDRVGRIDWSDDRRTATVAGKGYEVQLSYDDQAIHARGRIPLTWKLFVGTVRNHIRTVIERPL